MFCRLTPAGFSMASLRHTVPIRRGPVDSTFFQNPARDPVAACQARRSCRLHAIAVPLQAPEKPLSRIPSLDGWGCLTPDLCEVRCSQRPVQAASLLLIAGFGDQTQSLQGDPAGFFLLLEARNAIRKPAFYPVHRSAATNQSIPKAAASGPGQHPTFLSLDFSRVGT